MSAAKYMALAGRLVRATITVSRDEADGPGHLDVERDVEVGGTVTPGSEEADPALELDRETKGKLLTAEHERAIDALWDRYEVLRDEERDRLEAQVEDTADAKRECVREMEAGR